MSYSEVKYNINSLPNAEKLIDSGDLDYYIQLFSKEIILTNLTTIINQIKNNFIVNKCHCISKDTIIYQLIYSLNKEYKPLLDTIINASGIIIRNDIGGSPLSKETISGISNINTGYSNIDLGYKNINRTSLLSSLINTLFDSEDSIVVNNIVSGVYLVFSSFLNNGELLCSYDEIKSFSNELDISSIESISNFRLTKLQNKDFNDIYNLSKKIGRETKGILKITSNDRSTDPIKLFALSNLSKSKDIILFEILLSSSVFDCNLCNLPFDTSVSTSLKTGVDILLIPTNRMLGGPESCIIFAKKALIEPMISNPYLQMFLPDKLTLSALEATLQIYLNKEKVMEDIPIFRMMKKPIKEIEIEAHQLLEDLKQFYKIDCGIQKSYSKIGNNLLNHIKLPTFVVWIDHKSINAQDLYNRFMANSIQTKLKDNKVFIDPRCINHQDYKTLSMVFDQLLS